LKPNGSAQSAALPAASHPMQLKSGCVACDKATRRANHLTLSRPRCKNIPLSPSGKSLI